MGHFVTVSCTVQRPNGDVAYTGVAVQIDGMGLQEGAMLNQQAPYDAYDAFVENAMPDIWAGDVLIEEDGVVDPRTGQARRYTVMGSPNTYLDDQHLEFRMVNYIGQ